VALPLHKANKSSPVELSELHMVIIDALESGETVPKLAMRLAKGDKKKAKSLRVKLHRLVQKDKALQEGIYNRARSNLVAGLPSATQAAVKRAGRGRMDAVKFVAESTGFHNPRVQHEHSGDIKVSLDMPRPKFEQDVIDVPEADVVED
jgi:hypothetical protein